jgi:hypothetical protein
MVTLPGGCDPHPSFPEPPNCIAQPSKISPGEKESAGNKRKKAESGGLGADAGKIGGMTARQKGLQAATRRTVAALRKTGALEACDELKVANVMYTAAQLDGMDPLASPAMIASMTRAHLAACKALFGEPSGPDADAATAELLAILQDPKWLMQDASEDVPYRLPGQRPPWDR